MKDIDSRVDENPQLAGELVQALIRNRLGWSELEKYQDTGDFLWKHPILRKKKEYHELRQL
jgi:hypothetical protein